MLVDLAEYDSLVLFGLLRKEERLEFDNAGLEKNTILPDLLLHFRGKLREDGERGECLDAVNFTMVMHFMIALQVRVSCCSSICHNTVRVRTS
jgi:hypothetical protein